MLELLIKVLLSYLLGSLLGSVLLGRFADVDVRATGSGNPGATNALRARGWKFALGVLLIDVLKAVIAVVLVAHVPWPWAGAADGASLAWLAPACGAAAVIGHVWPLYHRLRGGKGAATLLGAVAVLMPAALVPMLVVWLGGAIATGYVGISTIAAAVAVPLFVLLWQGAALSSPPAVFAVAMAALMVFTHRENLVRMWRGEEHCFESFKIWRKLLRG